MAGPRAATLYRIIRAFAGARFSGLIFLGAVMFVLVHCFAGSPALAIERFIDSQGTIHISNNSMEKKADPGAAKAPAQPGLHSPAPPSPNLSPEKQADPEMSQAPPPTGLHGPAQLSAPPVGRPKRFAGIPAPKIESLVPSQRASEAIPQTPSASPPVAAPDRAPTKPRGEFEQGKKAGDEGATAQIEVGPMADGPAQLPETAASGITRVLDDSGEELPEEVEPDGAPDTVARSSISCSWDCGVLRITNVSVTQPQELAWRQANNPQPGSSPEACSEEAPEIQAIVMREEVCNDPNARLSARQLAESNLDGREVPSIRVYRGPGSVSSLSNGIENADQEDHSLTVST